MLFLLVSGLSCSKKDTIFQIDLIKYISNSYTSSFEESLKKGLAAAGLAEGEDYRLRSRSAQGEMANLTMLVDAAVSARSDLLITFQAPTLFTAIQRAPDLNKMFTLLQNPFLAGAGNADDDHLPNLTGLYMIPPLDELLDRVVACRPEIRTLGTIYDPGQDESVYRKDELVRMASERGLEIVTFPFTSQGEIVTAAGQLAAAAPQGMIHLQDPAQDVTFPALFQAARARKIPVFSLVYNMQHLGAVIACSTDREAAGERFAQMVVRVIRDEDPDFMPFEHDRDLPKRYGYNRTVASEVRLELPDALLNPGP